MDFKVYCNNQLVWTGYLTRDQKSKSTTMYNLGTYKVEYSYSSDRLYSKTITWEQTEYKDYERTLGTITSDPENSEQPGIENLIPSDETFVMSVEETE